MRKTRDTENTQSRVLATAEQLFAKHGFSGTSLAAIAERSGISVGLILYHFKSKEQLHRSVMEQVSIRYAALVAATRNAGSTPKETILMAMREIFNYWRSDRTYKRLSLWSFLEGDNKSTTGEEELTAGLTEYLELLQNQGLVRKELHPAVFLSLIMGPIHFWLRHHDLFATVSGEDNLEKLDELFITQLIDIISGFVT